jgi:hypothetical protein
MTDAIAVDDDVDLTEIVELNAEKVSAVGSPATGVPWLLMKGAAEGEPDGRGTPFLLLKSRAGGDADGVTIHNHYGAAAKSDSAEADRVQATLTGERSPDAEQPRHPQSGQFLPHVSGETASLGELAGPGAPVFGPHSSRGDLETALKAATDPRERERLAERLTLTRLREMHERKALITGHGGNTMKAATDANIGQFRKQMDAMPPGPEREDFGRRLTHLALLKNAYSEQLERTNAALEATMARNTVGFSASGGDPRSQTATIGSGGGTPQDLGAVSPVGNRGDNTGRTGKIEDEPAAVLGQKEKELIEATDPMTKARLGEDVTRLRLQMVHTPPARRTRSEGLAPVTPLKKSKAGKSQPMGAARLAARRALR